MRQLGTHLSPKWIFRRYPPTFPVTSYPSLTAASSIPRRTFFSIFSVDLALTKRKLRLFAPAKISPGHVTHSGASRLFRSSFGTEDVVFNVPVPPDVIYIGADPIIHVLDESTRFSGALFLPDVPTNMIWSVFLQCWSRIYTGLPNHIGIDEGCAFGYQLVAFELMSLINVSHTSFESHNFLSVGGMYHQPLRRTYRKQKIAHVQLSRDLLLPMIVKAMNETLGPEVLAPSAVVFSEFPQIRSASDVTIPRPSVAPVSPAICQDRE